MDLKAQIRTFILSNFYVADPSSVTDTTSLLQESIVDSTGVLEVISFLEMTYGITVDDSEMTPENLDSVESIARYVTSKEPATAI